MNPANFVTNHPYQSMIYAFLLVNLVATMPSPNGKGIRATTAYMWAFAFLHLINLPRLLVTIFPQFAAMLKLLSPDEAAGVVNAQALSKASTEVDKTADQAAKAADAVAQVKTP
jgi:hypothetical protein